VLEDKKSNKTINLRKKAYALIAGTNKTDNQDYSYYFEISNILPISDNSFVAILPSDSIYGSQTSFLPWKNSLARLNLNNTDERFVTWGNFAIGALVQHWSYPFDVTSEGKAAFWAMFPDVKKAKTELWLCVWDSATGKGEAVVKLKDDDLGAEKRPITTNKAIITWNPGGDKIAVSFDNKGVVIVDYKNKKTLAVFPVNQVIKMRWNNSGSKLGIIAEFNQTNWKLEGKKDGIINTEHKIQNRMYIYTAMTNSIRKVNDNTGFPDFFWAECK
jgi:hypothetical protein